MARDEQDREDLLAQATALVLPPAMSSAKPNSDGPSMPPPKPASEYSPSAAPRSSAGAAATSPAVRVADSAITSIEYTISRAVTNAQCSGPAKASTAPIARRIIEPTNGQKLPSRTPCGRKYLLGSGT